MARGSCRRFTTKDAKRVQPHLRLPKDITLSELVRGMNVEREHADVTRCSALLSAKIAAAHLRETPDYYRRLARYVER